MSPFYGIKLLALAGDAIGPSDPLPPDGAWLQTYDPDAHAGAGFVTWTTDPTLALAFPTAASALACYHAVSAVRPVRDDGRPNCPLRAFTITIERLP